MLQHCVITKRRTYLWFPVQQASYCDSHLQHERLRWQTGALGFMHQSEGARYEPDEAYRRRSRVGFYRPVRTSEWKKRWYGKKKQWIHPLGLWQVIQEAQHNTRMIKQTNPTSDQCVINTACIVETISYTVNTLQNKKNLRMKKEDELQSCLVKTTRLISLLTQSKIHIQKSLWGWQKHQMPDSDVKIATIGCMMSVTVQSVWSSER